jgi:hypothetical protein
MSIGPGQPDPIPQTAERIVAHLREAWFALEAGRTLAAQYPHRWPEMDTELGRAQRVLTVPLSRATRATWYPGNL